jgi:adenylate kinase
VLNKLLKIFSKDQKQNAPSESNDTVEEPKDNNTLASVKYSVKRNSPNVIIDIDLEDYDEDSALAVCTILDVLCEDFCYSETINMIRVALIQNNQEDLLLKIFTHISQEARDKILKTYKESKKDEPCIKPSDMLK